MKKSVLTCLLIVFVSLLSISYAQKRVTAPSDRSTEPTEFRKVQFGLGLGFNSSTLEADWTGASTSFHSGINFGTYLKFRFSKVMGLQPGIQISTQGIDLEEDFRIDLIYLQIPVVLKFYVFQGLNFDVGPQVGILTYAKFYDSIEEESTDWKDMFIPIDVALRLGINYEFRFGLAITTHYNIGLLNVNDAEDRSTFAVRNGVFQLGVLYYF